MPKIHARPSGTNCIERGAHTTVDDATAVHAPQKGQRLGRQAQLPVKLGFEEIDPAIPPLDQATAAAKTAQLNATYGQLDTAALLEKVIHEIFPEKIAMVSSFGSESALPLALIAEVAPSLPVIFLDSGKHFPETLRYRDQLVARLGLRNLKIISPAPSDLAENDPTGLLWTSAPDRCCRLRKVLPLEAALAGMDAWISGRKRYQGGERSNLEIFATLGPRIQLNPLAQWTEEEVTRAISARNLPLHPLLSDGYRSIGCANCTLRPNPGEDGRGGRWSGLAKTECGIHWGPDGRAVATRPAAQG